MADITIPLSERQRAQLRTAREDFEQTRRKVEEAQLVYNTYGTALIDGAVPLDEQRGIVRWDVTTAGLVVEFAEVALNVDPPAPQLVRADPDPS